MKALTEQERLHVLRTLSESVASVMDAITAPAADEVEVISGVTHEVVLRRRDGGPSLVLRVSVDERAAEESAE